MTFARIAIIIGIHYLFVFNGLAQTSSGTGVLREVWANIDGVSVSDLQQSGNFPENPLLRVIDPDFRAPVNWGDRYGLRMSAILQPQVTADYSFWVSGDDNCELWLSSDDSPANKQRIARVPGWTPAEDWDEFPEQRSDVIRLVAGNRYYIEALMKEHGGGDSLAVAWSQADTPQVIPGAVLTPPAAASPAPNGGLLLKPPNDFSQYAPNNSFVGAVQVFDLERTWPKPEVLWELDEGRQVSISDPTSLNPTIVLSDIGTYRFLVLAESSSHSREEFFEVNLLPPLHPNAGSAFTEFWFNVNGGIESLKNHPDYPQRPHSYRYIEGLVSRDRVGDLYGSRTRGYLLAPETGDYRFFVAGDEQVSFSLSNSDSTDGLNEIAFVDEPVSFGDYFSHAGQASVSVQLEAGERYAFELLHQEQWSDDHFSVAWQRPGSSYAEEISMEFVAPPEDAAEVASKTQELDLNLDYLVEAGPDHVIYLPQSTLSLDAYAKRRRWGSDDVAEGWTQLSGHSWCNSNRQTMTRLWQHFRTGHVCASIPNRNHS